MRKIVAMVTACGTACSETALLDSEDTPEMRAKIEADYCGTASQDAPIAGSWTDVSANEAIQSIYEDDA